VREKAVAEERAAAENADRAMREKIRTADEKGYRGME